jgi:hypothetical protein
MKKRLFFSGMILLALVLTSGTFAYTYVNIATTTLDVTLADAVMTTYEPSADQPDWASILPEGEYYSETLIPCATGDDTELPTQYPEDGEHWDKVDDQPADEGATYVSTLSSRNWEKDLYHLTDFQNAEGYETINNVTVYFRFAAGGNYNARAMAEIKTNGVVASGPTETQNGATFVTKSWQLTTNPSTNQPWTWQEINDLQAGVTMRGATKNRPAICTQVYVVVDYEFVITEGEVPDGYLYDITPHPEYTGDLQVKIYLTNTANLLKAYKYLNMKLYMKNSLEAEQTPKYQVLSMENGVVFFNIEGSSAESYTVEVIGGSYRLISDDPYQWGAGWSITPEFYCEVTQR